MLVDCGIYVQKCLIPSLLFSKTPKFKMHTKIPLLSGMMDSPIMALNIQMDIFLRAAKSQVFKIEEYFQTLVSRFFFFHNRDCIITHFSFMDQPFAA